MLPLNHQAELNSLEGELDSELHKSVGDSLVDSEVNKNSSLNREIYCDKPPVSYMKNPKNYLEL